MRIDLISEHASPLAVLGGEDAGGQNVHVAALATALAARGSMVRVHTRRDRRGLPHVVPLGPRVEVVHLDAGPPEPVPRDELFPFMDDLGDALAEEMRHDRPDVAHAHFWMSGYAALRARQLTGVPVAMTFHALGAEKRRQQGAKDTSPAERIAVEEEIVRNADLVIATTRAEAAVHEATGARRDRLAVIPCGVDLERFRACSSRAHRTSPRLRVGVVSRLVERKGIGNVIEAVAADPSIDLVIAGGPPRDELDRDPMVARYRALAAELGVADRVTLLGAVAREEVPVLMATLDVVACCPWYEPFGLVALEAMACGVPVVATRVGGLAETVVDGHTGLHVMPRCPREIASALALLREDAGRRQSMALQARRRAMRYGWDRIARGTEAALARLTVPSQTSEAAPA